MKHAVAFSLLMAGCGVGVLLADSGSPAPASRASSSRPSNLLDDLVRMTRTGSSDVAVLAYAKAHRMELPPELSDASLRWLRDSGVSGIVVRYMAAIDLRASDASAPSQTVSGSSDIDDTARPRGSYSGDRDGERDRDDDCDADRYGGGDSGSGRYAEERYTGGYADTDADYPAYPDYSYSNYGCDFCYSYGFPYSPFASFFVVDRRGSFGRFHHRNGRDHRFDGGRDGHRRGGGHQGGGFHDAWRERGPGERRGGSMTAGPRDSWRGSGPRFARGGFDRGLVPRASGSRGFGRPAPGRVQSPRGFTGRGFSGRGFSGPRAGSASHGGFRSPGFSGGSHGRAAGGFGGHSGAGPSGGRGRR